MKPLIRLLPLAIFLGGCASFSPLYDRGGETGSVAADGSSSPISQEQSWAIAKAIVAKREGWPEHQVGSNGRIDCVAYQSRRINNGGWRVVAHKAITAVGHGDCGFAGGPPAIITINKHGVLTHYVRQYEPKRFRPGPATDPH